MRFMWVQLDQHGATARVEFLKLRMAVRIGPILCTSMTVQELGILSWIQTIQKS